MIPKLILILLFKILSHVICMYVTYVHYYQILYVCLKLLTLIIIAVGII